MLKSFLLSLALAGSALTVIAQQAPPALPSDYVVTTQGDTLRGTIRVPRFVTESGVRFKANGTEHFTNFLPGQARGFGLANGRRFVRHKIVVGQQAKLQTRILSDTQDSLQVFLEQLTSGAARLYQLEYNRSTQPTPLEYSRKESVFFLMETDPAGLRFLDPATFRVTLRAMFEGCAAAQETVNTIKFEQSDLVGVALRYGACVPTSPAADIRSGLPPEYQLAAHIGFRVGAVRNQLYYSDDPRLARTNTQPSTGWMAGIYASFRSKRPIGFSMGLQYAERKSHATEYSTVPAGYTNAGAELAVRASVQVKTVQLPLTLLYAPTRSRLAPFLALGASTGLVFDNNTTVENSVFSFPQGAAQPTLSKEQAAVTALAGRSTMSLGFHGSVGIRPTLNPHLSPVLEIGYEGGQTLTDEDMGNLSYRGAFVRVGLDF